jgi:RNA polymerase sigma-70 factor (ECF subfamily)
MRPYLRAVAGGVLAGRIAGKVDVSDVVQQSLLASIERFEQFRGNTRGEWQKWLVVIVRNEARNLLRYWHQDRRGVAKEAAVAGSRVIATSAGDEDGGVRLADESPSPSQQVVMRQDASHMLALLDRLPHEHREVLRLRHFEGLSHQEIGDRLGKSAASVRQTWVRALRRVREMMA